MSESNDARSSGEEEQNRTMVYVASIPGMTQWSDDYDSLAEWAGGEENVRLWDLTDRYACDGCGRHVTLMGNGYCGHCQDKTPEMLTDGGRQRDGEEHRFGLVVVCSTCGEALDVDLNDDGDMITYGKRHDCWGDRGTYLAMITPEGITVQDDRIELEVRK